MLTLPIKKKWFDMICSGEKTEEYRAITPYYTNRFTNLDQLDNHGNPTGEEACIVLRNGYGRTCPDVTILFTLRIGTGKPEWGAEPGVRYYVLKIIAKYVERKDGDPLCGYGIRI